MSPNFACDFAKLARVAGIAAAVALGIATPASAHPHVFVTYSTSVVFGKGGIEAIDHVWHFDDFYSAMAVDGLDTNKDGKFSREELAELAKVNAEGLKEFAYFTYPMLAGKPVKFADPKEYHLEVNDNILSMHIRLPLQQAIPAPKDFAYSVYDPSFYISFELKEPPGATLPANAPKGCAIAAKVPEAEAETAKKLSDSFTGTLGAGMFGGSIAKTISVTCK